MLKKYFFSKVVLSVTLATAVIGVASAQTSKPTPPGSSPAITSFSIGTQAADGGCTTQHGPMLFTGYLDTITGLSASGPASDSNGYDPDCWRVAVKAASAIPFGSIPNIPVNVTDDFRICGQFTDHSPTGEAGAMKCTNWASARGSVSEWIADSNAYDPDYFNIFLEKRPMPTAGTRITDLRIGIQFSDKGCSAQNGTNQMTPWLSELGTKGTSGVGWSSFATDGNAYDPDCARLTLEAVAGDNLCRETIPASQQVSLKSSETETKGGYGNAGAVSGWITGNTNAVITSLTLKNGFNDRMIENVTWTGTQNMLTGGETVRVPYAGNKQIVNCPANHVAVGLDLYRGGGDNHETALLCKPVTAGTVNFEAAKEYSINGCGQSYCGPYYNFPTTGVVMVGGRFNTDNHKYLGSIVVAPVNTVTQRVVACEETPACIDGGRDLRRPITTSQATPVMGGNGEQVIGIDCTDSTLPITVATDYTSKKIVAGTCVKTTPGFFTSTNRTWVEASAALNGVYRCAAGSVITRFVTGGFMCQPVAGGANAFVANSERTITIGTGTAVNNYFNLAQNSSNKVWAPVAVEYQGGVPAQKNVRVVEVKTVASCTPIPPLPPTPVPPVPVPPVTPDPGANPNPTPPPGPSCSLTATPATIVLNVGSSRLDWNCTNGPVTITDDNASFDDIGAKSGSSGSVTVSPDKTTTFTVVSGSVSASATVTVGGSIFDHTDGL